VAFTLGLFGSLHCIGMCGLLSIAFCTRDNPSPSQVMQSALSYNLGRTATYAGLGLLFGLIGTIIFVSELQKIISILLGSVLVLTFLFNIDIDKSINGNFFFQKFHGRLRRKLA